MGISLSTNFTVNTALPIEDRMLVADLAARNAIPALRRWEGMIVYVISEGMHYTLSGGIVNGNWGEIAGGGGGISNWLTATDYLIGSVIIQNDKIYQSLADHTSGVFATDLANGDWKEISSYEKGIDSWITAKVYKIDDVVIDSDKIYKALSVHTSGVFDTDLTNALWTEVSKGGGGSGGINYILNSEADTNINGWTTYKDAAGTSPVDGTGGSSTLTFTRETSSPLRGAASFLLTKPASNVQGEGFSYDFTIDNSDKGKVLQGSFEYQIASGTFADNDISVWIYDVTNARMIQPAPYLVKNSGIIEKMPFEFQTSIDSNSYRLIVHVGSVSALAYTIKFDNVIVGPQAKLYGSPLTDLRAYIPSGTWVTNTTYTGFYSRIGDRLHVNAKVSLSGAPTGNFTLNIPSGLSIDTAKLSTLNRQSVGTALGDRGATSYTGEVFQNDATSVAIVSSGAASRWNATTPATWASSDVISVDFTVPIAGWSSSQVMSSDADTRVVAFNTEAFNVPYPSVTTPIIINATPRIDTHSGYNSTTGEYTIKVPGIYKIQGNVIYDIGSSATGTYINASVYKNGSPYNPTTYRLIAGSVITRVGFNKTVTLEAGDVITLRILATDATLSAAAANLSSFSVERLSGPAQVAASSIVSFSANTSTTAATTSNPFIYTVKDHDTHNAYSTITGKFTAPMSGNYFFTSINYAGETALTPILYKGNTLKAQGVDAVASVTVGLVSHGIYLLEGETVEIRPRGNATSVGFPFASTFSGFRIGGVV